LIQVQNPLIKLKKNRCTKPSHSEALSSRKIDGKKSCKVLNSLYWILMGASMNHNSLKNKASTQKNASGHLFF